MSSTKCLGVAWIALGVLAPSLAHGQEEPRVRDLTDRPLTRELLIEVLEPRSEPPPELRRTRGARSMPTPTQCEGFRQQRSRGITVKPAADVAAVEILFDFDSSELTPEASENLEALGEALASSSLSICCFEIEGHTDSVSTDAYNLDLSERRAQSVVDYLASRFSIDPGRLLVAGYGENRPIAANDTEAGRQKNRRVQIVNLGYGEVVQ